MNLIKFIHHLYLILFVLPPQFKYKGKSLVVMGLEKISTAVLSENLFLFLLLRQVEKLKRLNGVPTL